MVSAKGQVVRSLLVSLTVPFVDLSGAGNVPAPWGVLGDAGRLDLGRVRRVGRSIR